MPPNFATGEEQQQKFPHRWTFRRKQENKIGSWSSHGSSGNEPSLKRPKLASSLVPVNDKNDHDDDDGEANDVNEVQKKGSSKRKATTTSATKDDVTKNRRKNRLVPAKRGNQRRKKINDNGNAASDQVPLNELKNYMSSLLDDMKATRGNLLIWLNEELQKLISEEVALELDRRQCSSSQFQQQNGSLEATTTGSQYQNLLQSNQFECQTDFQPQQQKPQSSFEENNRVQNQRTLQANVQQQQQKNHFWSFKRDHSSEAAKPKRSVKNKRPSDAYNYRNLAAENPNDYSMAIVPVSSTEEEGREERFASSAKSGSLQEKQPKIVLGISAHHSADEASGRYGKGKRVAEDKQVNCSHAILALPSSENDKAGRLEVEPLSFTYNDPSGKATSSMYLTLPSVMNKSHGAGETHRLDAELSFNNNVQSRVQGSYLGYFQRLLQPEESSSSSSRSFTPLGSSDMGYFTDNCISSPAIGSGFPVGLHQSMNGHLTIQGQLGLEGLSRESSHGVGLRMDGGGIRFSGGSYSTMAGQHMPNNFHGTSMAFQDGFQFQK